jgi:hypothetical protein
LERGRERSRATLFADLVLLAEAPDDGDKVATDDGLWIGSVIGVKDRNGRTTARAVRTFHT